MATIQRRHSHTSVPLRTIPPQCTRIVATHVGIAVVPSVPAAAAFFFAYETSKQWLLEQLGPSPLPYVVSAAVAEATRRVMQPVTWEEIVILYPVPCSLWLVTCRRRAAWWRVWRAGRSTCSK